MSTSDCQLVVIGGGPGGYAAAFRAADLGLDVTLVESAPRLGGVCLLRGCIPSKALLHVARVLTEAREAAEWGIRFGSPTIDLGAVRAWKDRVIGRLADGVLELARRRGIRILHARATFVDSQTLRLEGADVGTLRFRNAILATGSIPAVPPPLAADDPRVIDSTGALELQDIPARLLVVGGGYIGLEMGTVYSALGSRVVVVEMTDGLLPGVDRDLVRPLAQRLKERFEAVHLNTRVVALRPDADGVLASLEGASAGEERFDRVLIAVGRRPNSLNLGLENTKVIVDGRGFVQVDRQLRTADANIFAIGDLAGEPMLAHKASHEGRTAAEVVAGHDTEFDKAAIPAVVFTDPEIAWCGLTETQARSQGREVQVARFPWGASGRAATLGRADGVTKLICDPQTQRVLGVGITGAGAGELIAEGVLAVEMAAVARDVAETVHPHPTLSETVGESAEAVLGSATHLFVRRA